MQKTSATPERSTGRAPARTHVAVVGAGAAGVSAALHAAAAGLAVTLIEAKGTIGGCAAGLARLEVVPGSPIGMTGQEWINRAEAALQAAGVEIRSEARAVGLRASRRAWAVVLEEAPPVRAQAVITATGAEVCPLEIPGARAFSGAGLYRGIPSVVPTSLSGKDALVLGEPNAAVAVALRLAPACRSVVVISADSRVGAHLSDDLVREVRMTLNLSARPSVEVVELVGVGSLEAVVLRDRTTGRILVRPAAALFVVDPETPRSQWLAGAIPLQDDGRIPTGGGIERAGRAWPFGRRRLPLETAVTGVFAAGAVRAQAEAGFRGAIEDGIAAARDAVAWLRGRRAAEATSVQP